MKRQLFLFLLIGLEYPILLSQSFPDGYIQQYTQNFSSNKSLQDFQFTYPSAWELNRLQGNFFLQCSPRNPIDNPLISLPQYRAILKNRIFGDFVLETDVMLHAGEIPQEVCIFLGLKDSTRYYFILLSTDHSTDRPGIYLVKNSGITKLSATKASAGSFKPDVWQKIRIERDIVKRTIRVSTGNPAQLVLEVRDYELIMGSLGFGNSGSPVRLDNIRIWAPTVITE